MSVGEKIKMLRLQKHMTLEEVGNLVGVGKSTVRKWETGDIASMKEEKIKKLAKALGTSPMYLMGLEDNPEPELTPVQQQAWEMIQGMSDEDLAKFVAMGKIMLGGK